MLTYMSITDVIALGLKGKLFGFDVGLGIAA